MSVLDAAIVDTPIAIIDFETTGLTPGRDRVVEVSVGRVDPGCQPQTVLDTLINPMRQMSASEIYGITDKDVQSAPRFEDIAGELVAKLSGCVVAAYNVYFDLKFLEYELRNVGVDHTPPLLPDVSPPDVGSWRTLHACSSLPDAFRRLRSESCSCK